MKILIAFSTEYGTAENCANKIKRSIDIQCDTINLALNKFPNIDPYDVIVLGGSIHMKKIDRAMKRFIRRNFNLLKKKNLLLYLCCLEKKKFKEYLEESFGKELVDLSMGAFCFGGEIDINRLSRVHKLVLEKIGQDKTIRDIKENNVNKLIKVINELN